MEMKPHKKSLGRNPLSDAPYQNPGMVLNGQGPGRHPLGDAPYLDLDRVLNEQGSGRRILSDVLHRRPGVVKNEQGSSHLTRRMQISKPHIVLHNIRSNSNDSLHLLAPQPVTCFSHAVALPASLCCARIRDSRLGGHESVTGREEGQGYPIPRGFPLPLYLHWFYFLFKS
jgi:hypothetical protein